MSSRRSAATTDFIEITGNGHITQVQKQQLHDLGCEPYEYSGNNKYICTYRPNDWTPILNLPFIQSIDPQRPDFGGYLELEAAIEAGRRLERGGSRGVPTGSGGSRSVGSGGGGSRDDSTGSGASNVDGTETVNISLHRGGRSPAEVQEEIIQQTRLQVGDMQLFHRGIRLTADIPTLTIIAEIDSVKSIEKVIPNKCYNNVARQDIQDESGFLINNTKYEGKGQIVAVSDTGFDKGVKEGDDLHPAFRDLDNPGKSRVLHLYPLAHPKPNDFVGHGTHVAGSILGDGYCEDENKAIGGQIRGTAPKASLVLQALAQQTSKGIELRTPTNLWDLLAPPYKIHKARVASNSWGPNYAWNSEKFQGPIGYNREAAAIDAFVWHNPGHVVLFAAGNDYDHALRHQKQTGILYKSQIGGVTSAKNCITVGATYSTRPHKGVTFDPSQPAGNSSEVTYYSSRGPTQENRLKPDVVCPGNAILSTASRDPAINRAKLEKDYGKVNDKNWVFSSGTSMATPLTAGCVTVLREALHDHGITSPSAALVKALLINGADDIGQDATMQGHGRVNLQTLTNFFPFGSSNTWYDDKGALAEDEKKTYEVQVDAGQILKVTLVYSDRKGTALQNNLTLKVIANGSEKKDEGHQFSENNVEQIVWEGIPKGKVVLEVTAERIARLGDKQPFALVWRLI